MKTIALSLALLLSSASAFGQGSCYSQSFGARLADPYQSVGAPLCAAQQTVALPQVQYQTVQVPVTTLQTVQVPVQTVQYQTVAVAVPHCVGSVGVANYGSSFGGGNFGGNFHTSGSFNSGFVGGGFGVNRFGGNFGAIGTASGTGVAASFADRRGNVVNAVGNRRVDVQRGLFGNIKAVSTDGGRGLLGRIR